MDTNIKLLPIILCGGTGSRLWPLSRKSFPKQYLSINNNKNSSFLQVTVQRIKNLENAENPIVICNEEHRFITAEQLRQVNIKPSSIILEPSSQNTAPAITAAALKAISSGNDPILLILPSDHDQNENEKTLTLRVVKQKKTFTEEKEVEFTFTAISKHPSPEKETKKKKDTSKERKSFADVVLKNQKTRKVTPCRSLLLAISASKISNPFTSQYHHILCMKKSSQVSQQWKISVKIPESLRFVRYRYAFASEEEEEDALNLDKNFVNIKWEVVPDRYLDTQSKYNNTLLSAGSLEFQNNVNVLSRKLITQKIKTKSMWKRRRRNLSSSSSSKLRLRASSTEWYPVYHARTPSPTNPEVFFGE